MTTISGLSAAIDGIFPQLRKVIEEWQPAACGSERSLRDSLSVHLKTRTPPSPVCRIEKEYREAGTTCDIYMKWRGFVSTTEIFIEIKRNLNRKTDFDRLVGQIHDLEPAKRNIVVLLCGETDDALFGRLGELFEDHLNDESALVNTFWFPARNLRIIRKAF